MKLKYHFEKMQIDDEIMAVPVGDNADGFHSILRINESAAAILELLQEDTTEESIVDALLKEYFGDRNAVKTYVHAFIEKLIDREIVIP